MEDNLDVREYIRSILKDSYEIHTASDGIEGIEKAKHYIPDLIISDVMMPGKDGYELIDHLRKNESTNHIPIILLTAKTLPQDKIEGLKIGANDYLIKPFDKEELLIRIENHVKLRQAMQTKFSQIDFQPTKDEKFSVESQFITNLQQIIGSRISDSELAIPDLCQAVHLSHTQFYRKVKALTGAYTFKVCSFHSIAKS